MTMEELEKSFLRYVGHVFGTQHDEVCKIFHLTSTLLLNYYYRFDDLEKITPSANIQSVESTLFKYGSVLSNTVETMKKDLVRIK